MGLPVVKILRDSVRVWTAHNAFQHAGALAFFTLFSLAPLVIILVAIVGMVFGPDAATGQVADDIRTLVGEPAAAAVQEAVRRSRPEEAGMLPSVLGVGALLFGATTVFAQMQSSLNNFWDVRARPSRGGILNFLIVRLLSLGMVLIIGFLLLISFALDVAISAMLQYFGRWMPVPALLVGLVNLAVSMFVTTGLIGMLFKVLPDVRLAWRDVLEGALATAVLFAVGQYLIAFYLAHVAPASTFGAAGSLVLVLFWVYYAALILFLGAALTRAFVHYRHGAITPRTAAVRVQLQVQEEHE
jgi:membrane protein